MTDENATIKIGSTFILPILVGIAAFATTGSLQIAASTFIFGVVLSICAIVAIVPFIGIFIEWFLITGWVYPYLMNALMVPAWASTFLFWWNIAIGTVYCIAVSIAAIVYFTGR